jgi:DTW domain-containing protein YfiP
MLRAERCLCDEIPEVPIRTRVIIVRHAAERFRPSNSARLVALAMPQVRILEHGAPGELDSFNAQLEQSAAGGAWLLWPQGPPREAPPQPLPSCLIVLDGSWSQARRMRHRLAPLQRLPCLALPRQSSSGPSVRLRRPPDPGSLPTLLAVARALALLEGENVAAPLEALYARLCERAMPESRGGGPGDLG